MEECSEEFFPSCVYPVAACSDSQMESLKAQMGQMNEQLATLGIEQTAPTEAQGFIQNIQNQINQCQEQINAYNTALQTYNSCVQQAEMAACQEMGWTWSENGGCVIYTSL